MQSNRKGFTLMEVLIVVLIIAILSAVAVPQYQKAVMKSRYSALMPIAKSLANGNEAYYMDKGQYATSPTELDVSGQDEKYPDGTKVDMSSGEYSYVLAKRDNLPLNYLVYQKHSDKFADNIHCEADENNPMAQEVCQGLGGELISGSQTEGYLTYVLSGMIGVNDKLPTSMSKLKAQICAGISDENCVVDEDQKTITKYNCGENITVPVSLFSFGGTTIISGCESTRYDADGQEIDRTVLDCKNSNISTDRTYCVVTDTSSQYTHEHKYLYDGNNWSSITKQCRNIDNGECTGAYVQERVYYPNDRQETDVNYVCKDYSWQTNECKSYSSLSGKSSAWGLQNSYNEQGKLLWSIQCTHRNADGACTSLYEGHIYTYADNGTTQTGNITVSCTVSHWTDATPCAEYAINNNGNRTTCLAEKCNMDTFEGSES